MDYLKIVLEGFFDKNSRKHLEKYFLRESTKAEKEGFDSEEFFDGCLSVITGFKDYILHEHSKHKDKLYQHRALAESGKLNYAKDDSNMTNQERWDQTIEYCNRELEKSTMENHYAHLDSITMGRYPYNMPYTNVLELLQSLEKAKLLANGGKLSHDIVDEKINKPQKPDINEILSRADSIIAPLEGYWNFEKIMLKEEFDRLQEYVHSIIKTGELKNGIERFIPTKVSSEFIRKTIYEVYHATGKKSRQEFIRLVHKFRQFDNTVLSTTKRKFSSYAGNYQTDIENMITY
jgi:hypothetical protein